jgi:hypothetical protein
MNRQQVFAPSDLFSLGLMFALFITTVCLANKVFNKIFLSAQLKENILS